MNKILLLGAGRSASVLLDYLLVNASTFNWQVAVGDVRVDHLARQVQQNPQLRAFVFDVQDEAQRREEIGRAEVVISMLPALFHPLVAQTCLDLEKHLVTASYVPPQIKAMHAQAEAKGLTFLMECGLDPGIDHLSAMRLIHQIQGQGGTITSFKSFTGGLMAPESDNNPWHYKFTWNPRNVILAGQGTARYKQDGSYKYIPYPVLFRRTETFLVEGFGYFDGYANRDSLGYLEPYGLEGIQTMLRGTLRRPGYCQAWQVLVHLGLTDDSYSLADSSHLTYGDLVRSFLPPSPESHLPLKEQVAAYLRIAPEVEELQLVEWTGLFDEVPIDLENATPAQALEKLLVQKWKLEPGDKDMIVMLHELEYEQEGDKRKCTSSLVVLGEDEVQTAMAKTVGLPLGIATKLLLQGKLQAKGVVVPLQPDLYLPILAELEQYGIRFTEREEQTSDFGVISRNQA
ncbi:saccharopine dehydrogenase family protein [Rufibacter glacialis]|uniref:Saccharopine dehydrogenase n=1 Tax=Rufibacter glacialis TaxID=1259555 RepID=A0A5M8QNC8_9BACT|nr:saccharopine dehydrogenase C-terminal domain-containing protein [Rufibacter glacialis]KAA6435702.1 saccharopine dehydrogenase [Rufibacter glacialis]GGK65790.1 saccharopine dehydrogenase [Rufibacter glacialis]